MRDRDQQQRTDERPQNNSSIADHMTLLFHFDKRSRMFDLVNALSRNSNTAAAPTVNKRLFAGLWRSANLGSNRYAHCGLLQSDTRTRSRLGGDGATARAFDFDHGRICYRRSN